MRVDWFAHDVQVETHTDVKADFFTTTPRSTVTTLRAESKLSMSLEFCILSMQQLALYSLKQAISLGVAKIDKKPLVLIHARQFLYVGLQTFPTDICLTAKHPSLICSRGTQSHFSSYSRASIIVASLTRLSHSLSLGRAHRRGSP